MTENVHTLIHMMINWEEENKKILRQVDNVIKDGEVQQKLIDTLQKKNDALRKELNRGNPL